MKGFSCALIGVDEVGRGAWAGPFVCAGVVALSPVSIPKAIKIMDSKLLSAKQREVSADFIRSNFLFSIQSVPHETVDLIGIQQSTKVLFQKIVTDLMGQVKSKDEEVFQLLSVVADGRKVCDFPLPFEYCVKGDAVYSEISAASIIAKVFRDSYMKNLHGVYPEYAFDANKGYGTKDHYAGLLLHGLCPEHRRSFFPMKTMLKKRSQDTVSPI